jgi:hypothetical protein
VGASRPSFVRKDFIVINNFVIAAAGLGESLKNSFKNFADEFHLNFIEDNRWTWLADGLVNTLIITAGALILGIFIGILVAAVRSSFDKNHEELKKRGVLVRHFDKPRIAGYNRITVGSEEEMQTLLAQIKTILEIEYENGSN